MTGYFKIYKSGSLLTIYLQTKNFSHLLVLFLIMTLGVSGLRGTATIPTNTTQPPPHSSFVHVAFTNAI